MTARRHHANRIHVRRLLLAAPLLGLSLTANANFIARTTHGNFQIIKQGRTSTLAPPQTATGPGTAVASTGTVTATPGPGVVTGGMGATTGATAAAGVTLTGTARVPVNGNTVPVQVKTKIEPGVLIPAAIAAATCMKGGPIGAAACAAGVVAAPLAVQWLASAGARINPETGAVERQSDDGRCYASGGCTGWRFANAPAAATRTNARASCVVGIAAVNPTFIYTTVTVAPTGPIQSQCEFRGANGQLLWSVSTVLGYPMGQSTGSMPYVPASMDDIAPYMRDVPVDPALPNELTNAGHNLGNPTPEVTGPSSVAGPTVTTTTNNTTNNSTTTNSTTTNHYTYNTNNVTNTHSTRITTTSTTVTNGDGSTTTTPGPTTTETETPGEQQEAEKEEQPTQCDKYPDSLGCAQLDTPDEEVPKRTETVTFEVEDVFGGGQCPADVTTSLQTLGGQSVKIVDWQTFCGMAIPLRGLVMALASIMAFFIIMPGGVRE